MPEQVEKIHEFSLPVQNGANSQTDSKSGFGMTVDLGVFIFYTIAITRRTFLKCQARGRWGKSTFDIQTLFKEKAVR